MLELFGEEPECVESGAWLAAGISDPSGAAAADKKKKTSSFSGRQNLIQQTQFCDVLFLKKDSGEIPMI